MDSNPTDYILVIGDWTMTTTDQAASGCCGLRKKDKTGDAGPESKKPKCELINLAYTISVNYIMKSSF